MALTQEAVDAIVESVERGTSLRQAAFAIGFSEAQLDDWYAVSRGELLQRNGWLRHTPESGQIPLITSLTSRCQRALGARVRVLTSSLYHNATTLNAKTGWYDTQAADKLLSKSPDTRSDWHEERHTLIEQTGTVSHEHTLVRALEPEALEAAYRSLEALPDARADTV